jgi:hypothetical protein
VEAMMKQAGLFGLSDRLKRLSANGDPLEELGRIVDFEGFRPILNYALGYRLGSSRRMSKQRALIVVEDGPATQFCGSRPFSSR